MPKFEVNITRIAKNTVLISAIGLLGISSIWFVYHNWFKPSPVSVELANGDVSLIRKFDKINLNQQFPENIYAGDSIEIGENSTAVLVFNNGQNVSINGKKQLLMTSSNKFGSDQLFVFQDTITGKIFSYSIKFGLDKSSAAVVAANDDMTPNVLGAFDQKVDDSSKYEQFSTIFNCVSDKKTQLLEQFKYSVELKNCLLQNQLNSVEDLK
jgi:hypothetical protein